jgi:hypothetical protein
LLQTQPVGENIGFLGCQDQLENQAHWVHLTRSKRSREINPFGSNPVIWAQPVQPIRPDHPTRLPTRMLCKHLHPHTSRDYPGSKGHDARYQTGSCVRSFIDGTSPIKDRTLRISDCGPEISVYPKPRLHQLPISLCTGNRLTAPKTL